VHLLCSAMLCHRHCRPSRTRFAHSASAIAVLALGSHHTPLVLVYSSFSFYCAHTSSLYGSFPYHRPPSASHRTLLAATRTLHEDMDITHGTPCTPHTLDALQLQQIFTETSTWTQRRLTDTTTTARVDVHTLDSLTHPTPPKTILTRLPAPHLGTTSPVNDHPQLHHLATTTLRRLLLVVPPNDDRPPPC
jgi:hypothetical protein